ncbi:Uncharacterised protein [Bordetella pertussis]|nr:Uncharacterised protein [Bordetella pertussis]
MRWPSSVWPTCSPPPHPCSRPMARAASRCGTRCELSIGCIRPG